MTRSVDHGPSALAGNAVIYLYSSEAELSGYYGHYGTRAALSKGVASCRISGNCNTIYVEMPGVFALACSAFAAALTEAAFKTWDNAGTCIRILLATAVMAVVPVVSRASVFTWDGGGADNNWSTGLNWTGNSAPPTASSTNDFHFAGSLRLSPNAQAAYSILSLTFDSGASSFTIGGSTLTIYSGGVTNSSTNTETINNAVTLGAAQTWSATSGNLTFGGNIANGGFLLTIGGGSNTTSSGVISGSGGLTKNGAGTLTVGSANTYTGATTVNGGDLSTGTFTLSTTATVSIASGATYTSTGTLNLNPSTTAAQTFVSGAGTLRLRNSSSSASAPDIYYDPTGNATSGSGFQVTIASNIDVGTGTQYINGISQRNDYERYGGDLVFSGNLTGSANLTFTGTPNTGVAGQTWQVAYTLAGNNSAFTGGIILTDGANLTLNNANALTSANTVTFTPSSGAVSGLYLYGRSVTIGALSGTSAGTMNIRNGSLVTDTNSTINPGIVRSNAVLTVQQDTNTTFNGVIGDGLNDHGSGDAGTYYTLGLTKTGTGTLTLGGANTYTGGTNINGGTLALGSSGAIGSSGTISFGGGTLQYSASNTTDYSGRFSTATNQAYSIDTNNQNVTFASALTSSGGSLTKLGSGTLTLTGANTYTGGTTINGGILALGADSGGTQNTAANSLGTGAITINSGAQLRLGGSPGGVVSYSFSNGMTLNGGTIVVADGAQHFTGTFAVGASGGTLTTQYAGKDLYLDGVVSGSGALLVDNLAPANFGDGQVHFTGTNTYSGTLTVSASGSGSHGGKISVDSNNALASATIAMNGPRDINFATTAPVFGALSGTGNITLTTGLNLSAGGNNATTTYSGIFSGAGSLTKAGTGTMTLGGANTYTGKTSIQNGTLSVSSLNKVILGSASSSLGAPTTAANGTIDMGTAATTGTLIYTGSGETTDRVINLAGTTGGAVIENDGSGALTFSSNLTATGAGSKTLTLQGSNTGSNTISGVIVDNSVLNTTSVTKAGAGTWVLSGANTYTGKTSIQNGTLSVSSLNKVTGGSASSSLGAPTTVANGTIDIGSGTNSGTLIYTGLGETTDRVINLAGTTGGATIQNDGTSALTFSSNLTATGAGSKTLILQGSNTLSNTVSGVIVDNSSSNTTALTKAGAGTWVLSGANTYSGGTTVSAGTLQLSGSGTLGSTSGALTVNGGTLDLAGTNQGVGNFTGSGGTIVNNLTATNVTLTIGNGNGTGGNYSGVIADHSVGVGTVALTKTGTGTITLSGANTYTGKTSIQNGTLSVSSLNKVIGGSLSSNLGAPLTAANGTIDMGSTTTTGTLIYTGSGETTDRVINLAGTTGGATIQNDGTGALTFSSNLTATGAGSKTLTLQGSNTGNNTVSGVIVDNSPSNATSLTKAGAGKWILSGATTYTGATTISSGTLSLDSAGSTAARLANTSGISVNSGGTLLLANSSGTTSTDRISNSATVTLNGGGTFNTGGLSEGTRPTNGSATNGLAGMGALTLANTSSGSHAVFDFGSTTAGSSLVFSSLSAASKGAFVDILNWGGTAWTDNGATTNDRLLFATDPGFTASDLANFAFSGFATGAVEITYGNLFEICPVPEPSTYVAGILTLSALFWNQRRRLFAVFHRSSK